MKDIRWGWVLLCGLLGNVAVALLIIPFAVIGGQERLGYVAPPASFVGVLVVGYWIARKAPQRALLHGLLVGVFAVLIYIPVLFSDEITPAHILASGLKVLGGVLGGFLVARRAATRPAASARAASSPAEWTFSCKRSATRLSAAAPGSSSPRMASSSWCWAGGTPARRAAVSENRSKRRSAWRNRARLR